MIPISVCFSINPSGDFRMIVGEDRNKVRNIVLPHVDKFIQLYQTHLKDLSQYVVLSGNFLHQVRI